MLGDPCLTCNTIIKGRAPNNYCSMKCAHHSPAMEWSPELAYLTGLIASDGFIVAKKNNDNYYQSTVIGFVSTDDNLLYTVEFLLKKLGVTYSRGGGGVTKSGKVYDRIRWTHYPMLKTFIKMGMTQKKSNIMPGPELPLDKEGYNYFWLYLRGVIDGDGTVLLDQRRETLSPLVRIVSGSPEFLKWVERELRKRGLTDFSSFLSSKEKTAMLLAISPNHSQILYQHMYGDYPQYKNLGHKEKQRRLSKSVANVSRRPHISKMKKTREKIYKSLKICEKELGYFPSKQEYKKIREEKVKKMKSPRDFPYAETITRHHFDSWEKLESNYKKFAKAKAKTK